MVITRQSKSSSWLAIIALTASLCVLALLLAGCGPPSTISSGSTPNRDDIPGTYRWNSGIAVDEVTLHANGSYDRVYTLEEAGEHNSALQPRGQYRSSGKWAYEENGDKIKVIFKGFMHPYWRPDPARPNREPSVSDWTFWVVLSGEKLLLVDESEDIQLVKVH